MAVFDENTNIDAVSVDDLVGEGKKFKTVDDLARGKAESDRAIAQRERELAELREELNKRASIEEMILKVAKPQNQSADPPPEPKPAAGTTSFTDEDLIARIREVTQAQSAEQRVASNIDTVTNRMLELFGTEDKANEVVNQKARELGVSTDFLQSVAAQSPKAFFTTIGVEGGTSAPPPGAPRSDVDTQRLLNASPGPKPNTYSYYENIRKTDPVLYFTPKIQNQLMKDAFEKGDAFYS